MLPTRRLLLPKGAFHRLHSRGTAIDSTLAGHDHLHHGHGHFQCRWPPSVLMERGTKLVGETRGQVQQGSNEGICVGGPKARTPAGIIVPLASPGTDELGRSGLPRDR